MQFNVSRGTDPGLTVLELNPSGSQPINSNAVTPSSPLRVHLQIPLDGHAEILPFAFDGEFYIPLGYAVSDGGKTLVELQRLPTPVSEKERSLTGSIRILFQKLVVGPFGLGYDYPVLSVASLASNRKVSYEHDADNVKGQVAAAQRILVCVHGIIGDTRAMAASLLAANSADLVLAFDYENINTTIEENAQLLKERLAASGLGPGHGKTVQIVAHSMGGLIARWFIEKLGGNDVVQSLVAAGTPQDGSPWPNVEGFIGATTSLVLNNLTAIAWQAKALGFFVRQARSLDKALPEIRVGSDFLKLLAQCGDPKVRYTFLAGNTSKQKPSVPAANDPWYQWLTESVSISDLLHRILSVAFFNEPNDIAVSVKSATNVAAQRQPPPVVYETACDHLTYFADQATTELLWKIVGIAPASMNPGQPQS
jgi:pimeloyl-ACP methyl ester carboxylesterase